MTLTPSPPQGAAVTFLDPTGSVRQSAAGLAPRIPDLAGKVLGVVDDGLPNCDDLLRGVVAEIEQRYELAEIVRVVKPSFSAAQGRLRRHGAPHRRRGRRRRHVRLLHVVLYARRHHV